MDNSKKGPKGPTLSLNPKPHTLSLDEVTPRRSRSSCEQMRCIVSAPPVFLGTSCKYHLCCNIGKTEIHSRKIQKSNNAVKQTVAISYAGLWEGIPFVR